MREERLTALGVRRSGGRYQLVGDLEPLLARDQPESVLVVGLGLRGLTAAGMLAAARGLDLGFVRSHQKEHGTGRVLDGAEPGEKALVVVAHPEDRALLEHVPQPIEHLLLLDDAAGLAPAALPAGVSPPPADPVDPADHLDVLHGSYRTSSGFEVERYIETVRAACTYQVAAQFSSLLEPVLAGLGRVCAIAHGGALLAAVAASRRGMVADLFHPPHADGRISFTGPTCFLDDYIMIGTAQRNACLAVAEPERKKSRFVAVYGPVESVDFGEQRAEVLVVAEAAQRAPVSPFHPTEAP